LIGMVGISILNRITWGIIFMFNRIKGVQIQIVIFLLLQVHWKGSIMTTY
jgi:hypothetical protein